MADYQDTRMGFQIPQVPPADQLKGKSPEELVKEWEEYWVAMIAYARAVKFFDKYAQNLSADMKAIEVKANPKLQLQALRQYHAEQAENAAKKIVAFTKQYVKSDYPDYQDFLDIQETLKLALKSSATPPKTP